MRPLFLDFETDPDSFDIEYQYMFGYDLMVAPVTEQDAVSQSVYFPPLSGNGSWVNIWNGLTFLQGFQEVGVRDGHPPVFIKPSSKWKSLFQELCLQYSMITGKNCYF